MLSRNATLVASFMVAQANKTRPELYSHNFKLNRAAHRVINAPYHHDIYLQKNGLYLPQYGSFRHIDI